MDKSMQFFKMHIILPAPNNENFLSGFSFCLRQYNARLRDSIFEEFGNERVYKCNPNYYNYVLTDGEELRGLLERCSILRKLKNGDLVDFMNCCFYVGKGSGARKISHLFESLKIIRERVEFENEEKTRKILDLWKGGRSVAVLILGQDRNHYEAMAREFALIKALNLDFLTNKINSTAYGEMKISWSDNEITNFGILLLFSVLQSSLVDWPTFIYEKDLVNKQNKNKK